MRTAVAAGVAAVTLGATACSGNDAPVRDDRGQVREEADVSVFHLQVGDCTQRSEVGELSSVAAAPCDQPHAYEVFAVATYRGDSYEVAAIDTYARQSCASAFTGFVGRPVADSVLAMTYITPTGDSFDQGDREVTCLVGAGSGPAVGTLRDANR